MTSISIVTPMREDSMEFERLMESLKNTTTDPSKIELVLIADDDDVVLLSKIPEYENRFSEFNVKFHIVKRSEHFVRDYYNHAAKLACGRWILAINIDVVFMTNGWDLIINDNMTKAAEKFKDDMLYGIVHDGLPRSGNPDEESEAKKNNKALWHEKIDFSCWILTSKEFVNFFGGMMDDRNWLWGADHWTGITWQHVQNGERVVMIRNVLIDHISHHVKDLPKPESFKYFVEIMNRHPMIYTQSMAAQVAERINSYIAKKHAP